MQIFGDLCVCWSVEKVIVKGPADVLVSVDSDWSKVLVRMSNDDVFILTNWLENFCLELVMFDFPLQGQKCLLKAPSKLPIWLVMLLGISVSIHLLFTRSGSISSSPSSVASSSAKKTLNMCPEWIVSSLCWYCPCKLIFLDLGWTSIRYQICMLRQLEWIFQLSGHGMIYW